MVVQLEGVDEMQIARLESIVNSCAARLMKDGLIETWDMGLIGTWVMTINKEKMDL